MQSHLKIEKCETNWKLPTRRVLKKWAWEYNNNNNNSNHNNNNNNNNSNNDNSNNNNNNNDNDNEKFTRRWCLVSVDDDFIETDLYTKPTQ